MTTTGEFFSRQIDLKEQQRRVGAISQSQFDVYLAMYTADWRDQDPDSFRQSKYFASYGATSQSVPGLLVAFEKLPAPDQALALWKRFGGDLRAIKQAAYDLNLPGSDTQLLLGEVQRLDQGAFNPVARQVRESLSQDAPKGLPFTGANALDRKLAEGFNQGDTVYGARGHPNRIFPLDPVLSASQGALMTGQGETRRMLNVKGPTDPTDPAKAFRQLKTIFGQSGFQTKTFVRKAGSDTLEPVYPEGITREDASGNPFRAEFGQNINFVVMGKRFLEEGQAFTNVNQRYEAVEHAYYQLPGIRPDQITPRTVHGQGQQIELAPGQVIDMDDYHHAKITIHSSDSEGTTVLVERSLPLEGYNRHDISGGKQSMAGAADPRALDLPADVDAMFFADFTTVSKNPAAYWYSQVVRRIHEGGPGFLQQFGYGDLWDPRRGSVRWSELQKTDHQATYLKDGQAMRGGLTRFQVMALHINAEAASWVDPTNRSTGYRAMTTGSFTRSGAYSWGQPRTNPESAMHVAAAHPALYGRMLAESASLQENYAEVTNTAFLNAGIPGVASTNARRVLSPGGGTTYQDRSVDLSANPEIAGEIIAAAQMLAKTQEIGFKDLSEATHGVLVRHGINPTARLRFTDQDGKTLYLSNAKAGAYFSGPHLRQDMTSLLDDEESPEAVARMQAIISRYGRARLEIIQTLATRRVVKSHQSDKLFDAENEIIGGHDFQRNLTSLRVKQSWAGPTMGDKGMAENEVAAPDNVLVEMFPELAEHPERMAGLKEYLTNNVVTVTASKEPAPSANLKWAGVRLVPLDSVRHKLTIQEATRLVVHPKLNREDFDGDAFKLLVADMLRWNGGTHGWEQKTVTARPLSLLEMEAQRQVLEDRTRGRGGAPGLYGKNVANLAEDAAKMAGFGGSLFELQNAQIFSLGGNGSFSMRQMQAGLGWIDQSKTDAGINYNLGQRNLRALSNDDPRFADAFAKFNQVFIESGHASPGLARFNENLNTFQPATGSVRRAHAGGLSTWNHLNSNDAATFDTLAAFMQVDELGDDQAMAEMLVPDHDPQVAAKRATLIEIRQSKNWARLAEVFGEHPWDDAAGLTPIIQLFRAKASRRWANRLESDNGQSSRPLAEMSDEDRRWAEIGGGLEAGVNVSSAKFGGASHEPFRTSQQRLADTASRVLQGYQNAVYDDRLAEYYQRVIDPMLGIVNASSHKASELIAALKDQALLLAKGPLAKAATGGGFVVPEGFPNDSYTIGVQSGEEVTVTTPAQRARRDFELRRRGGAMRNFAAGGAGRPAFTPGASGPGLTHGRSHAVGKDLTASEADAARDLLMMKYLQDQGIMPRENTESVHGVQLHSEWEAAGGARPQGLGGIYSFSEMAAEGTIPGAGLGPGGGNVADMDIAARLDRIQMRFDAADGRWKYQILEGKSSAYGSHAGQLGMQQWLLEHGTILPGQGAEIRDSAGVLTGYEKGAGQNLLDFLASQGLTGFGAGPGQAMFEGAEVIVPQSGTTLAEKAADMQRQAIAASGRVTAPPMDPARVPAHVANQIAAKKAIAAQAQTWAAGYHALEQSTTRSDQNLYARLTNAGSFQEQLAAAGDFMNYASGNTNGRRASPSYANAGSRGSGNNPWNMTTDVDMTVSAPQAANIGAVLQQFYESGHLDMTALSGSGTTAFFRPEAMKALSLQASILKGTAGGTRGLAVNQSEVVAQALIQQNLPQMAAAQQAFFTKGSAQVGTAGRAAIMDPMTGQMLAPAVPASADYQAAVPTGAGFYGPAGVTAAFGETRGRYALGKDASGAWSTSVEAVTANAPQNVRDLVPTFKDLAAAGQSLHKAFIDLHSSTTAVGKQQTAAQSAWADQADTTLKKIATQLVPMREAMDFGSLPAEGSEEAQALVGSQRLAPRLTAAATRMSGNVPTPGSFKTWLQGLFNRGGHEDYGGEGFGGASSEGGGGGSGGLLGRVDRGQQLLTGVQLMYMSRLDRVLVEPALQGVAGLATQDRQRLGILAGLGMPSGATTTMSAEGAYMQMANKGQLNAGMTWGPFLKGAANSVGNPLAGIASILGPAAGVGMGAAYALGQASLGMAALPVGIGAGLAVAAGGLMSRDISMQADPTMAGMIAYQAQPRAAQAAPAGTSNPQGYTPAGNLEVLTRAFGAYFNAAGAKLGAGGNLWQANYSGAEAFNDAPARFDASQAVGARIVDMVRAGVTSDSLHMTPPGMRQGVLSTWLNGAPGADAVPEQLAYFDDNGNFHPAQAAKPAIAPVVGALDKYGLDQASTLQGKTYAMRYGLPEQTGMDVVSAGINLPQAAGLIQSIYGGKLESAATRAAAYSQSMDPLAWDKAQGGLSSPLTLALARAGAPPSDSAVLQYGTLAPQFAQQSAQVVSSSAALQDYNLRTGRGQSSAYLARDTAAAAASDAAAATTPAQVVAANAKLQLSMQHDATNTQKQQAHAARARMLTSLGWNINDAEAQATKEEAQYGGDLSSGAGFLHLQSAQQKISAIGSFQSLAMQAHVGAGAALSQALAASSQYGGDLSTGAGAQMMQTMSGVLSGDPNITSLWGAQMGNQVAMTGLGQSFTGGEMVTRQLGGVTGALGLPIGTTSLFSTQAAGGTPLTGAGAGAFAIPAFASLAQASFNSQGLAGNALLGGYTPLGVRGGWLPKTSALGTWGQNIGGQVGIEFKASDLSYQNSLASAGISAGNVVRERAFATGQGLGAYSNPLAGQPLPWSTTGAMGTPFVEGQGTNYWTNQQIALGRTQTQYGYDFGVQQRAVQAGQFGQTQALNLSQFTQTQDFNRMQSALQFTRGVQDLSLSRTVQMQGRQYQTQDFAYERGNLQRNYGWEQEDIDFNLRFATGRDRILLERQKKRSTVTENVEAGHIDTLEARQKTQWKNEDTRYFTEVSRNAEDFKIRTQQFDLEKKHYTESAALSLAQFTQDQDLQKQNADRTLQFTKDQWAIEDKLRQLQLADQDQSYKAQLAAIGLQVQQITQQKILSDQQLAMSKSAEANQAKLLLIQQTQADALNSLYLALARFFGIKPQVTVNLNQPGFTIPGNAAGFSGLVNSSSLMSLAEGGQPEYVSVLPFGRPGFGYSSASGRSGGAASGGMTQVSVYLDSAPVAARVETRLVRRLNTELRR